MKRWMVGLLTAALLIALAQAAGASPALQDAIDVLKDGDTYVIMDNVTLDVPIVVDKAVRIEAAPGTEITVTGSAAFRLRANVSLLGLTIIDDRADVGEPLISAERETPILNWCILRGKADIGTAVQCTGAGIYVQDCEIYGFALAGNIVSGKGSSTSNLVADASVGWRVGQDADFTFSLNSMPATSTGIYVFTQGGAGATNYHGDLVEMSANNGNCIVKSEPYQATARGGRFIVDGGDANATLEGALRAAAASTATAIDVLGDYTVTGEVTLPGALSLTVKNASTLSVARTMYVDGALTLDTGTGLVVQPGGTLAVGAGGSVVGDGALYLGGALTGEVGGVRIAYRIVVNGDVSSAGIDANGYAFKDTLVTLTANAAGFSGWTLPNGIALENGGAGDRTIKFYPAMPCAFTANVAPPVTEPAPDPLRVEPASLTLSPGERGQLTASEPGVAWTSSDAGVATVNDAGLVTAVGEGEAMITATATGARTATCAITVTPDDPGDAEQVGIGIEVLAVRRGKQLILPKFKGYTGTWSVDDGGVARLNKNGTRVQALKLGSATLTYKVDAAPKRLQAIGDRKLNVGDSYVIRLNVRGKGELVTKLTLDMKKLALDTVGNDTARLDATLKPDAAPDKQVFWMSSDPAVARVDAEGNVKAVGPGKCKITAVSASLRSGTVNVTVEGAVALRPVKKTVRVGGTATLTATIAEALADKALTWSSSKPAVASVEDGVVTAHAKGKTVITVQAANGDTARCTITVKK